MFYNAIIWSLEMLGKSSNGTVSRINEIEAMDYICVCSPSSVQYTPGKEFPSRNKVLLIFFYSASHHFLTILISHFLLNTNFILPQRCCFLPQQMCTMPSTHNTTSTLCCGGGGTAMTRPSSEEIPPRITKFGRSS